MEKLVQNNDYYPGGMLTPQRHESSDKYRYGFNGKEKDDEVKGVEGSSYDFGGRILDPRVGRWLSVDPVLHSQESPYAYVSNNPIIYIDKNGNDNIIYLVLLPSAREGLSKVEIQNIIDETNTALIELGLKTQVSLFESSDPFDSSHIDDTDTYILLGSNEQVIKTIDENPEKHKTLSSQGSYKDFNKNGENPEKAALPGQGILVDSGALKKTGKDLKTTKGKAGAFLILHALGHNVGIGHSALSDEDGNAKDGTSNPNWLVKEYALIYKAINPNSYVIDENGYIVGKVNKKIKTVDDTLDPKNNPTYAKKVKETLGDCEPSNNYESTKKIHEEN